MLVDARPDGLARGIYRGEVDGLALRELLADSEACVCKADCRALLSAAHDGRCQHSVGSKATFLSAPRGSERLVVKVAVNGRLQVRVQDPIGEAAQLDGGTKDGWLQPLETGAGRR